MRLSGRTVPLANSLSGGTVPPANSLSGRTSLVGSAGLLVICRNPQSSRFRRVICIFVLSLTISLRGESKFEISTLSVNPTLRRWGGQVFDAKDYNFGFSLFNDCQD